MADPKLAMGPIILFNGPTQDTYAAHFFKGIFSGTLLKKYLVSFDSGQ